MLEEEVIGSAIKNLARTIVFPPKKNGLLRFCVDYWKLNAVKMSNSHYRPRMDEYFGSFEEIIIFCTVVAKSGYRQIELDEYDLSNTAFTNHYGLFQFV